MTQENKELVFRDLCARLPYGVKCYKSTYKTDFPEKVVCVINNSNHYCVQLGIYKYKLEHIKPYLFPLSSMTEEQKREYDSIIYHNAELHCERYYNVIDVDSFEELQEFYHKNHFDYRGLIEKSLALDATNLGIYE